MNVPAIDCDHLVKQFGPTCALHDVSLRVPTGEVWALTGDNGCGKSTLMRLAAGIMEPTEGTIRVLGRHPDARTLETSARVSYLAQGVSFSRSLTVRDIARFAAHRRQLPISAADEALARLEMSESADLFVGLLPHQATKQLALAVAMMGNPEVMLLDEPTEWLDRTRRDRLTHLLLERPTGQTVLIATPLPGDLEPAIDVLVTMDDGRVVDTSRLRPAVTSLAPPFHCSDRVSEDEAAYLEVG